MKKFSLFFLIPLLLSSCSTNKVRISSFIYADDDIFIEEMSKNLLSSFHYGDIDYHSYSSHSLLQRQCLQKCCLELFQLY